MFTEDSLLTSRTYAKPFVGFIIYSPTPALSSGTFCSGENVLYLQGPILVATSHMRVVIEHLERR